MGRFATDLDAISAELGAIDVVSICSPTAFHHEHLAHALALRPRVIFCEKPLTSDMTSAKRLAHVCRAHGVTLVVNYSRRWDPAVDELVAELNAGRWGTIRSVVGHYNKGVLNNGSHLIDLLLRLVGPMELVTTACTTFDFSEHDPTAAVLLTARNDSLPVYLNPSHARDFAYFELEIVCELGVIRMQSGGKEWLLRDAVPSTQLTGYRYLNPAHKLEGRYLETMGRAIEEIYAHLEDGVPVTSSVEDALQVQALCVQMQKEANRKYKPPN